MEPLSHHPVAGPVALLSTPLVSKGKQVKGAVSDAAQQLLDAPQLTLDSPLTILDVTYNRGWATPCYSIPIQCHTRNRSQKE